MKDKKKEPAKFKGPIKYLSFSPHGDPEGFVLANGTFVKVPPHSLLLKDLFKIGATVSGEGELLTEKPNRVVHRAKVHQGKKVMSDDSGTKDHRESLKEIHKKDLKARKSAPSEKIKIKGTVVAVGTKPKGEVDRIIFQDGFSVHVPKEMELSANDIAVGDKFEIKGESRAYGKNCFVKAESVKQI